MRRRATAVLVLMVCLAGAGWAAAQEADAGLDLRATLTTQGAASNLLQEEPRYGAPVAAGFHGVLYPTWKISENWFASGAVQLATRPYYYADMTTAGFGAKGNVLQAALNYAKVWKGAFVLARAGELPTAFGAFPLRYDDMVNPLVDLPVPYGYYGAPVSITAVAGAQVDATKGRWDGRVQFANSSPANPRSIFATNQYGNWVGGAGYTIRQGFRVGASAYHGPYLDNGDPGAWRSPSHWPAQGYGVDASWAHSHTSVIGELQRFVEPYSYGETERQWAGYAELKQVLAPRWFIAGRYGEADVNLSGAIRVTEAGVGFRPNRLQLIKVSYQARYGSAPSADWYPAAGGADATWHHTVAIQWVTSLHAALAEKSRD